MADAMVTARISSGKKEAGNRIFEKLGTNASKVINDLYDYVLKHEALPFDGENLREGRLSDEKIALMREVVRSVPKPPADSEFATLSDEEIKRRRYEYLVAKHGGA